jgi:hypothetical protein
MVLSCAIIVGKSKEALFRKDREPIDKVLEYLIVLDILITDMDSTESVWSRGPV